MRLHQRWSGEAILLGSCEEKQRYAGGNAYPKTVTTTYDAVGNRAPEAYPSSLALVYTYNDVDRLSSVTDGTKVIAAFTYAGTRPKGTTFGNGTTETRSYTGFRGEVASIHHQTSGSATLVRMDYGYDAVHDRTYERFGASGYGTESGELLSPRWRPGVDVTRSRPVHRLGPFLAHRAGPHDPHGGR